MHLSAELIYLSAGCNNSPHCAAWNSNELFLYGSEANIIVCNAKTQVNECDMLFVFPVDLPLLNCILQENDESTRGFKAFKSLRHHSASVNCVRWIGNAEHSAGII